MILYVQTPRQQLSHGQRSWQSKEGCTLGPFPDCGHLPKNTHSLDVVHNISASCIKEEGVQKRVVCENKIIVCHGVLSLGVSQGLLKQTKVSCGSTGTSTAGGSLLIYVASGFQK